jgi:phospholipid transport system substrate-binding protein
MRTETTRWGLRAAPWAAALALCSAALPAAAGETPRQIVRQTVDEVLEILGQQLPADERRTRLENVVYARFDFKTNARLVLARNWKRFSDVQQEEFVREYRTYLANSYGARLDRYSGEKVAIVGDREEPRGDVTVMTRIDGGEYDGALVDYRLRSKNGEWLVIDVIVEGVSLVSNYRDQFKEVLANGGPPHLLEKLKEKNAAGVTDLDEAA